VITVGYPQNRNRVCGTSLNETVHEPSTRETYRWKQKILLYTVGETKIFEHKNHDFLLRRNDGNANFFNISTVSSVLFLAFIKFQNVIAYFVLATIDDNGKEQNNINFKTQNLKFQCS